MKARHWLTLIAVVAVIAATGLLAAVRMPSGPAFDSLADGSASSVWGQTDFATAACAVSDTRLCGPSSAAVDTQGNLWVADTGNSRVLMFPSSSGTPGGFPTGSATLVFGQHDSMTSRACNGGAATASATSLCRPSGVAVDSQGTLYVADTGNNRVTVYLDAAAKTSGEAADFVLGQGDFTHSGPNDTPSGFVSPVNSDNVYVCDQPAPASECTMSQPASVSVDGSGDLLVADTGNNRVLMWEASTLADFSPVDCVVDCFIPADVSWGQGWQPNQAPLGFATVCPNGVTSGACPRTAPSPTAATMNAPTDAKVDASAELFVADTGNNRVLEFDGAAGSGAQMATLVYGQAGSFTTGLPNGGAATPTAATFRSPRGMALDPSGHLWVADTGNNRVLEFPAPLSSAPGNTQTVPAAAVGVLGQQGFTSNSANSGGLGNSSLSGPSGVAFDAAGDGFVADAANSRVLGYSNRVVLPPDVAVHFAAPTFGSNGWFNAQDKASGDVPVVGTVTASDTSNVSAMSCTVNGSPATLADVSGLNTGTATASISISTDGINNVVCTATDGASPPNSGASVGSGNTASVKIDTVAPTVIGSPDRSPDHNGWYNHSVTVSWSGNSDDTSGIASCDGPSTYSGPDGATANVTAGCVDSAGNTGSNSYTFRYDSTPPSVTGVPDRSPDHGSWYNHAFTVSWSGNADDVSGIANCDSPLRYAGPDSVSGSVTGHCMDNAGNVGGGPFAFQFDSTPPTVTGTPSRLPDHNGWYNHALTVTWSGNQDDTSGVASCDSAASYSSPDSAIAGVGGTCSDNAGNVGRGNFSFRYDSTKPNLGHVMTPAYPASTGWYNRATGAPTISFPVCNDAISGIDGKCPGSYAFPEGTNQRYSATVSDEAGNGASDGVSGINVDLTPPKVTCSATPNVLSRPDKKFVRVTATVNVADSGSMPNGYKLVSITTNEGNISAESQGWIIGTASTSGYLQADRRGDDRSRVYTLTYQGSDKAGNTATCNATVTVPHDRDR